MVLRGAAVLQIVVPQAPKATVIAQIVQSLAIMPEPVRAHALQPGRLTALHRLWRRGVMGMLLEVVEVESVPPRLVRDVGEEAAIWREGRLKDTHCRTTSQRLDIRHL